MLLPIIPSIMRSNMMILRQTLNATRKFNSGRHAFKESTCTVWRNPDSFKAPPKKAWPHMDELPVPCGEFYYYAKGRRLWYQIWLLIGITWFILSVSLMVASGSFDLNASPPHVPSTSVADLKDPMCVTAYDIKDQLAGRQS